MNPPLRFGLFSDCQYADKPRQKQRFYRESLNRLEEAVSFFNRQPDLDCVVQLGDLIDEGYTHFEPVLEVLGTLRVPLLNVLGNHDFEVAETLRARVPGLLCTGFGSRRLDPAEGVSFLLLDTTEVGTYRPVTNSAVHHAAQKELDGMVAQGLPNAVPWNSRPSAAQLRWLEREVEAASREVRRVVVFGHHPVFPTDGMCMWRAEDVHAILRRHASAGVYINGHEHDGAYALVDGVHYVTLRGMVEEEGNAYALATLYADRLVIDGFGREPSRECAFL